MGRGGGEGRVPSLMTAAVEREVSNSYFFSFFLLHRGTCRNDRWNQRSIHRLLQFLWPHERPCLWRKSRLSHLKNQLDQAAWGLRAEIYAIKKYFSCYRGLQRFRVKSECDFLPFSILLLTARQAPLVEELRRGRDHIKYFHYWTYEHELSFNLY